MYVRVRLYSELVAKNLPKTKTSIVFDQTHMNTYMHNTIIKIIASINISVLISIIVTPRSWQS